MLKSVIQALPAYSMSCFKLPKSVCKEISQQTAQFLVEQGENRKKMHWLTWEKLIEAKEVGGLGLKDLEAFNMALLGKQV